LSFWSGNPVSYRSIIKRTTQEQVVRQVKQHKLYAWLTVAFFLLTIITGYEKK